MFVFPHGIHVDRAGERLGRRWAAARRRPRRRAAPPAGGHHIVKFSPDGKVLLRLGMPGMTGTDAMHFNQPSDVITAPNGDIFVADGHGGESNARIVKYDRTGKFIKDVGHARIRARPARRAARAGDGLEGAAVRRRSRQQPDSDLRSERHGTSTSGASSAGRAASTSTRTTSSMSPTPSRTSRASTASGSAASASAARATAK